MCPRSIDDATIRQRALSRWIYSLLATAVVIMAAISTSVPMLVLVSKSAHSDTLHIWELSHRTIKGI